MEALPDDFVVARLILTRQRRMGEPFAMRPIDDTVLLVMRPRSGTSGRPVRRVRNRIARVIGRRPRRTVASRLPKHGVGAEIGVFKGDFSAQLLAVTRPTRLHLIDPWQNKLADGNALHANVCRRFATEIGQGTIVVHRSSSAEVSATLEPLDWVYIDGNHSNQNVTEDLTSYYALVKPGGIIAGDDYGVLGYEWGDGVREAVDEFVHSHGLRAAIIGHQFIIAKPA